MPKFESPLKSSSIQSLSGNTTLLHLGDDNRVGVLTDAPESELHVDGTITATGLVVPPSIISAQGDSATTFGFNPNFNPADKILAVCVGVKNPLSQKTSI